jgi:hypothetical protein
VVVGSALVDGVVSPGPAGGIVVGGTVVVVSSVGKVNGAAGSAGVPFGRKRPFESLVARCATEVGATSATETSASKPAIASRSRVP